MKERLFRSRKNRVISGVSGGLGEYLNIDPVIIRVLFVLLTLFNGIGLLIYIVMWIVTPEAPLETLFDMSASKKKPEPGTNTEQKSTFSEKSFEQPPKKSHGSIYAGLILIALGLIFLLENIIPYFDFWDVFPIGLILLGAAMIFNSFKK